MAKRSKPKPPKDDGEALLEVILFDSEEEMNIWMASEANIGEMKRRYNPRTHRCLVNKEKLQVTILEGRE